MDTKLEHVYEAVALDQDLYIRVMHRLNEAMRIRGIPHQHINNRLQMIAADIKKYNVALQEHRSRMNGMLN